MKYDPTRDPELIEAVNKLAAVIEKRVTKETGATEDGALQPMAVPLIPVTAIIIGLVIRLWPTRLADGTLEGALDEGDG